jgi:hypothetical protein
MKPNKLKCTDLRIGNYVNLDGYAYEFELVK